MNPRPFRQTKASACQKGGGACLTLYDIIKTIQMHHYSCVPYMVTKRGGILPLLASFSQ